ncbi:MAG: hypothetical protein M1819_002693 [Sarea resinae]|nr:MAG: hypothetical protein M1819_002693 [Sarea resinae]
MDAADSELESFRRRWREEVLARSKGKESSSATQVASSPSVTSSASTSILKSHGISRGPPPTENPINVDETDEVEPNAYHDLEDKDDERRVGTGKGKESDEATRNRNKEPKSALEHYEKAVEKEAAGSLGDSLNHYRKAYRLDARVDQTYKNKYYPPSSFSQKPANPNPSNAAVTVPNTAHHSLDGLQLSMSELIAEFADLSIPAAPPPTDQSPAPPCPIASVPSEVLVEILSHAAILDVASFVRLAQVCKRFAFLVAREEGIWKRVCCGGEFGFGAMLYDWTCDVLGAPLHNDDAGGRLLGGGDAGADSPSETNTPLDDHPITLSLLHDIYSSSWLQMFRARPRIRFNGCYISTVNYVRPGASSPNQVSWNTPVHIVTYYRYLRFFRDGTVLSLLTTAEPTDVVHYLTRENVNNHHSGALPSAVVKNTLKGRWRLSGPFSVQGVALEETEGDVHIETEGVDAKYMYKMHLSMRSAGRGAKNNKLNWKGFWSYNRLTDDWGEFMLKNDKAFFWSRVKSYGLG